MALPFTSQGELALGQTIHTMVNNTPHREFGDGVEQGLSKCIPCFSGSLSISTGLLGCSNLILKDTCIGGLSSHM